MDKEEILKIKKAIRLIHHEDKHYEGLNILAKLVGWKPFLLGKTKQVDLRRYLTPNPTTPKLQERLR